MTEAALHLAVAKYLAYALPDDAVWTTFPSGGGGKIRGARLKAAGLKAGWPDLQIIYGGQFYGIELKAPGRSLSPEQRDTIAMIERAGGFCTVVSSLDGVQQFLKLCGIPTKARLA